MAIFLLSISLILSVVCTVFVFKIPRFMYYFGLAVIYVQTGLLLFRYNEVYAIVQDFSIAKYQVFYQMYPDLIWAGLFTLIPFFIPLLFAYFTRIFVSNIGIGIVFFLFFSITQVIIIGRFTGEKFLKGIIKIIVDAIPILSFFITLFNVFPSNEPAIASSSDMLIYLSFCCILILIYAGFLIILYLYYNKNKKVARRK